MKMLNKDSTFLLVEKINTSVFLKDISWATDLNEDVNQDFFVHNYALTTCELTNLLGQDPMKSNTMGKGVCSSLLWGDDEKKTNKGILNFSADQKYAWLLMQRKRLDSVVAGLCLTIN